MNIDSYVEGSSFYHKFDARPKLAFTLLYIVAVFTLRGWIMPAVSALLPLLVMLVTLGWKEAWRALRRTLPVVILIFLLVPFR